MPLGVGGLEVLYADPAQYRAGVLSAVAYCGPSGAGSQVVSSVYLLILLLGDPSIVIERYSSSKGQQA